jgi:hypothetical protein
VKVSTRSEAGKGDKNAGVESSRKSAPVKLSAKLPTISYQNKTELSTVFLWICAEFVKLSTTRDEKTVDIILTLPKA